MNKLIVKDFIKQWITDDNINKNYINVAIDCPASQYLIIIYLCFTNLNIHIHMRITNHTGRMLNSRGMQGFLQSETGESMSLN